MRHRLFFLLVSLLLPSFVLAQSAEWNQFRGPNHDNKSAVTGISKSWPEGGPKLLWKTDHLGAGYGNISFYGDKMYALGDVGNECMLIAMNRETGEKIWSKPIGAAGEVGRYFGPRSTPAVDGKYVFAYGQFGDFVCFDGETGTEIWGGNVADEFGGKFMNNWGFSSSPILDGDFVLLPIGGPDGTVMAFRKNGQRAWRTAEIKDDAPYGSVVPVTVLGKKQYLLYSMSGVFGINPEDGKVLWHGQKAVDRAICSDPVLWEEDGKAYVMASMFYGVGTTGFVVTEKDGPFSAEQTFYEQSLQNHHGGLILHNGYVYMTTNRALHCVDIKTGKTVWQNSCVGKGSVSFVDGHLIVRSEKGDGTMALVEATPEEYREKGRFDQPDRSDKNSWTYPVIVDGKMYVRDQNVLLCYELTDAKSTQPTQSADSENKENDRKLATLFQTKQSDVQVRGAGTVIRLLTDEYENPSHQRFILKLQSGQTLLITHNIDLAPRIASLAVGDRVEFSGEYYYNEQGGGVDWTHHDPDKKHTPGWLLWKGQRFQ